MRHVCGVVVAMVFLLTSSLAHATRLQVGAFQQEKNLQSRARQLQEWGYEVQFQETASEVTRVRTLDLSGNRLRELKKRLDNRNIKFIQLGEEPPPSSASDSETDPIGLPSDLPSIRGHRRSLSDTLVNQLNEVIGTEYAWGAESPENGFDCSGLLFWLFNKQTPRTVDGMWPWTDQIERENLQPGDFVFFTFDSLKEPDHVGLYLGGNTFVHASSSYGVIRADLQKNYYQRHLYGYGRPEF